MASIVVYSRPNCGYCELAKRLLERKQASYSELDVAAHRDLLSEMIGRTGGRMMSLPQIFIGDRHIGGYLELAELERRGALDALLDA
jgi:glutaredoxin 3